MKPTQATGWDGIELWLGDVPWFQMDTTDAQVTELRRKVENAGLVVSNVLARREETALFVPIDPAGDGDGAIVVEAVTRMHRLASAQPA